MAAEKAPPNDERQWATDSSYEEEMFDTGDVHLPASDMWIRMREIPPMKLTSIIENENLGKVMDELDDDTSFSEVTSGDVDVSTDARQAVLALVDFFRDTVVPAVVRPKNAHWNDPPDDPEAEEIFDLSNLIEEDMDALMNEIGLDDAEGEVNETGDYVGKFQ